MGHFFENGLWFLIFYWFICLTLLYSLLIDTFAHFSPSLTFDMPHFISVLTTKYPQVCCILKLPFAFKMCHPSLIFGNLTKVCVHLLCNVLIFSLKFWNKFWKQNDLKWRQYMSLSLLTPSAASQLYCFNFFNYGKFQTYCKVEECNEPL